MHYEQLIIGSEPDAVAAAIAAAEQGSRIALIDNRRDDDDGVTIDILNEAVGRVIETGTVSMSAVRDEVTRSIRCRRSADRAELECMSVDVIEGPVRFLDANSVEIEGHSNELTADSIVLACGSKSADCGHLQIDDEKIIHVESLLKLEEIPQTVVVVGAGRTGLEHAILLARLGVEVTVVDEHSSLSDLCGNLMEDTRPFEAQSLGVVFRLGDEVIGTQTRQDGSVSVRLSSGKSLAADVVVVCVAREGRTEGLDLEAAGVGLDEHGRVWCDASGRTWAPHIKAIGQVIGFRAGTLKMAN